MNASQGFSMIEVLVSIVILAIGLLGLATLQTKAQQMEMESLQRNQALILVNDLASRMEANIENAGDYVGNIEAPDDEDDCTALSGAARDLCEWEHALAGASVEQGSTQIGAMIGAQACITQIQASNATDGACQTGIWQISVAWQGLVETAAPADDCGENDYGDDKLRRVMTAQVAQGHGSCMP